MGDRNEKSKIVTRRQGQRDRYRNVNIHRQRQTDGALRSFNLDAIKRNFRFIEESKIERNRERQRVSDRKIMKKGQKRKYRNRNEEIKTATVTVKWRKGDITNKRRRDRDSGRNSKI